MAENEINKEKEGATIRFLGLWDVVTTFSPISTVTNNWDFTLADNVEMCCHAMALDERRKGFGLTRVVASANGRSTEGRLEEMWFRGVHSDVGGGFESTVGLSSISLYWMLEWAKRCGLPIAASALEQHYTSQNPDESITDQSRLYPTPPRQVEPNDLVHESVRPRGNAGGIEHNDPPSVLAVES